MSSSRSAIDEALSPDDLEELSELMFSEEKPRGKHKEEQSAQNVGPSAAPAEKPDVDTDRPEKKGYPEASASGKQHQGDTHQNRGAADHSPINPGQTPANHPSKPNVKRPDVSSGGKRQREAERPTFTIGADQMATLRVVGSSRTDPLGSSASAIARRLFDLFGYNGRHPAAVLHGQTLDDHDSALGPLIDERQWEDLLEEADERATALRNASEASFDVKSLDEDEARLVWVCYLVQEALYEAGFGDRRRRRKNPF